MNTAVRYNTHITHHTRYRRKRHIVGLLIDMFVVSFVLIAICFFVFKTNTPQRYYLWKLTQAKSMVTFEPFIKYLPQEKNATIKLAKLPFTLPACSSPATRSALKNPTEQCKVREVDAQTLLNEKAAGPFLATMKAIFFEGLWFALFASLAVTAFMAFPLSRLRQGLKRRKLKGERRAYCKSADLAKMIKHQNKASNFYLGGVPLIKHSETGHIVMTGSKGQGQLSACCDLLSQVRSKEQRAVVYDKDGTFVERFYRPGIDIILNPLDERGAAWSLWAECKTRTDFEKLAIVLMPEPKRQQDKFCNRIARALFAVTSFSMMNKHQMNTSKLLHYILTADIARIKNIIESTEAEHFDDRKIESIALQVKAIMCKQLACLKYVKEDYDPFSIHYWAKNSEQNGWLFVCSVPEKQEAMKPLVTAWVNLAVDAMASKSRHGDDYSWLAIDDLSSLQPLPGLKPAFSKSSQSGSCFVVGVEDVHQYSQLIKHADSEIYKSFATGIHFNSHDQATNQYLSKEFGEYQYTEVNENISYDAYEDRDDVTMEHRRKFAPVIRDNDFSHLSKGSAYLNLPGNWPATKVHFEQGEIGGDIQPSFIPVLFEQDTELERHIQQIETQSMVHQGVSDEVV